MIFSQYKKTCEVLLDDPKIYVKTAIRNILHANIDVYSRSLISELPVDGVKFISKLQYHCTNINFSEESRYARFLKGHT